MVGEAARLRRYGLNPDGDARVLEPEIRAASEAVDPVTVSIEMASDHHFPSALEKAWLFAVCEFGNEIVVRQPEVTVTLPEMHSMRLIVGRAGELFS